MVRRLVRMLLTLLMDVLVLVAVVLLARIVVEFFAQLSAQDWAGQVLRYSKMIVAPLGLTNVTSPYHGTFDVDAGVTLLGALAAEWFVALWRDLLRR